MKHLQDIQYHGHEIVICHDGNGYTVDVRADDYAGAIIGAYCDIETEQDAIRVGKSYVDGLKTAARQIQSTIQGNYGV